MILSVSPDLFDFELSRIDYRDDNIRFGVNSGARAEI